MSSIYRPRPNMQLPYGSLSITHSRTLVCIHDPAWEEASKTTLT